MFARLLSGDSGLSVKQQFKRILTAAIAAGIAWGIIAYVLVKVVAGKYQEVNAVMGVLFVLMVMFYLGPGDQTTFEYLFSNL